MASWNQNGDRMVKGKPAHVLQITEQFVHYHNKHHHDTPKTEMGTRDIPINAQLYTVLKTHVAKLERISMNNSA